MRLVVKNSRNRAHACLKLRFLKKMKAADFDCHDCYVGEIWDWVGVVGLQMAFVSPSLQGLTAQFFFFFEITNSSVHPKGAVSF